ncbi:MAG: thioredoxin family protein [Gemmataceae bacterium]
MIHLVAFVALGLGADPVVDETVPIAFTPGEPKSKLAPRYSPKGTQLTLTPKAYPGLPGFDHLETHVTLGPNRAKAVGQLIVIARSLKGEPYDRLYIDTNGDGSVSDEKAIETKPSLTRGNHWSSFPGTLKVDHGASGREEYPVNFWAVVEKADETPKIMRFSRQGFLTGKATLGGVACDIVLSDSNNDGVFGAGDWWEIRPTDAKAPPAMRTVGDYAWAAKTAWRLDLAGTNGHAGKLVRIDPGVTPEEDEIKRDRLREDKLAPRAAKPVPFRKDAKEAIAAAEAAKKPYFLKFEADWCMGCKEMDLYVFTARDVAAAAEGIACIKIDVDVYKDLREKYKATGLPAGVLFDGNGKEIARHAGYAGVKDVVKLFEKAKK